ncbi:chemotaxis protein CheX [Spirochaeta africana]|uniref:Putative inhibitor of MCP methylation, CheC n=1 Tax=Spirochaeta africana (strain ATCC 700263 / DSM 8902 / Z-7692) TaxID=889378 RepID=H9UHN7_SPIAZ|nr:chemotaxis protein CheX [Spirochaeta africana]AFG37030.1 putative inhibitor of MCP methylation, CheC [Spirochaeta africana DSM 8902]
MQAKIINPFLAAAIALFKDTFGLEAVAGEIYAVQDQINHRWEISGVLGITGDHHGVVALRLPRVLADKMLHKSGVHTRDEHERQEMVNNMVGELTNIIAGNAANQFEDADIDISPPVVVLGAHHEIHWPRIAPVIGIPFRTPAGPFEVDVCLQ